MAKLYVVQKTKNPRHKFENYSNISKTYFATLENAISSAKAEFEHGGYWDSISVHELKTNNEGMFIYNKSFTF